MTHLNSGRDAEDLGCFAIDPNEDCPNTKGNIQLLVRVGEISCTSRSQACTSKPS